MKRFRVVAKEINKVSYILEVPEGVPPPATLENWAEYIAVAEPAVVVSIDLVEVCSAEELPVVLS